jgi:hypothetical protein
VSQVTSHTASSVLIVSMKLALLLVSLFLKISRFDLQSSAGFQVNKTLHIRLHLYSMALALIQFNKAQAINSYIVIMFTQALTD